jgi:hypothetical protein
LTKKGAIARTTFGNLSEGMCRFPSAFEVEEAYCFMFLNCSSIRSGGRFDDQLFAGFRCADCSRRWPVSGIQNFVSFTPKERINVDTEKSTGAEN